MPVKNYVLAVDEGTTGVTGLLIDDQGSAVSKAYREIRQIYPQPGWVEQDPVDIFQTVTQVAREALQKAGIPLRNVKALGITGQRETAIIWERATGRPVMNAVVWQCRRTAQICEDMTRSGMLDTVRSKTGLTIDAYFSATKLRWILDHIPAGQRRAERGELAFGTVDSWLIWNLTGGKVHATDVTNASRTMLFNIHALKWDEDLLAALNIPASMLPQVLPSSHIYGETVPGKLGNLQIPICGVAGDQQASLFGQACFEPGMAKNTYGTGSFVLLNTGETPVPSKHGLVTTLAWQIGDRPDYALEGSVFMSGAVIQWLRDGLRIIQSAAESEILATSVANNGGVYLVPAFVGLGAPYWDMYARGTMVGLTRGTTREHLARASLEAIAYQSRDVVEAMEKEAGLSIPVLRVDGGATANRFLMQFQADISGIPVQPASIPETTAVGAAYLAGLTVGVWKDLSELALNYKMLEVYEPKMSEDQRESLYAGWKRAIRCAQSWSAQQ